MMTIHSLIRCAPAQPTRKLGLTYVGRAEVISMVDNGVTNLCGKILSKLIHCVLDMLIKMLSFSINMFYFLKIQSMYIPETTKMKSDLTNIL